MTGNEIRKKFLDYFAARGHSIIASSALVPYDDPTLLFTNAGMVQFKRVFMGEDRRPYVRAATSQRCVRAGGKHNDLENVGYTARHHTFFEMLGNFSFGDYFKRDAISFAWEFLTSELGLPKDRLWVSVFQEDDEAFRLWEEIDDLPKGRIIRLGAKDNFWAMGDTGPCGPCSEILIDQGPEVGCGKPECRAGCDCDRYLELWNLVFMQFYRAEDGTLTPLPKPSIDTGMGLERISAVVQGVHSNYDSDLFQPFIQKVAAGTGKKYGADPKQDTAMRVIADHCRATTFLIADGVLPSNEGRGYVLRRLLRRAIRYGRKLGIERPFLTEICRSVIEHMSGVYPHIAESADLLDKVVRNEEERFFETIDNGLAMLQGEVTRLKAEGGGAMSGEFMFKLYDTFGFPVDIVRDIALEEGFVLDEAGYHAAMEGQRQQSKKSWKGGGLAETAKGVRELLEQGCASHFHGYETRRYTSTVAAIIDAAGNQVQAAAVGAKVMLYCPETVFYAEAGGQAGDQGEFVTKDATVRIDNTITGGAISFHVGEVVAGTLQTGAEVEHRVAEGRRQQIANNHSATHLLHAAMRRILGDHVRQSGSLVDPERLRFDFTHFAPLSAEEIEKIEFMVNDEIRGNRRLETHIEKREEAQRGGAMALFGEKYGETVRVVRIGDFSKELCGGTHVGATGEIGLFKIVNEGGIAAGVRRIEAVTGWQAFSLMTAREKVLAATADLLKTTNDDVPAKVAKLLARVRDLEKQVTTLTSSLSATGLEEALKNPREVGGLRLIASRVHLDSPKTLREIGDRVRDKMGSAIAVLGGEVEGKAALLVVVSKDLTAKCHAGNIIKELAAVVGGSGGGRPDMAQAGGPLADKLDEAISRAGEVIARLAAK